MSDVTATAPPAVPPEMLETFSKVLAQTLAEQGGDSQPLQPIIRPLTPIVAAGDLAGGFTLKVEYGTTTYAMTITVPSKAGDPYVFEVTGQEEGKPVSPPYVSFKFVSTEIWALVISTPGAIPAGPVKIDISLNLSMGTMPA